MIGAVRSSVDREDHPDWLYALQNELSSPEKPVGEVRASEYPTVTNRVCNREPELGHRHPRDHSKKRTNQQQPLEKADFPIDVELLEKFTPEGVNYPWS